MSSVRQLQMQFCIRNAQSFLPALLKHHLHYYYLYVPSSLIGKLDIFSFLTNVEEGGAIRGVACSAKEKVSSGETLAGRGPLGRKFLPFFSAVDPLCVS